MAYIHPTAKVHPTAIIHDNVTIGPLAVIEAYSVIGSEAEHKSYFDKARMPVHISRGVRIREYVTVNAGTVRPTIVEKYAILLRGCHVGHDAIIGVNAILSCNVLVGGHSIIGDWANLGLGSIVKQKLAIGAGVMLGMGSVATKHLEPWKVYVGSPAKYMKLNITGKERAKRQMHHMQEDIKVWEEQCKHML